MRSEGAVTASYYEILEVDEHASHEVIKRRFLDLSLRFRRELEVATTPHAIERVEFRRREVDEAWAVLRSPADRARYDDELRLARGSRTPDRIGDLRVAGHGRVIEVEETPVFEIVPLVEAPDGDAADARTRARGRRWRRERP